MFAPYPVEAFFCHAQRDDHIHVVAVVLLRRVFQRGQHTGTHGQVAVVHQVRHLQRAACLGLYLVEAGDRVYAFPFAQAVHDLVYFALLVFQAFAGIHIGNMDDGLQCRVQHLGNGVNVRACVEEVANVQRFEPLVTVELLVVGVGDRLKFGFIRWGQNRLAVTTEVGTGHGHQMHLVAGDEGTQLAAQHVTRVAGDVMELVDGDQAVIERCDA